MPLKITQPQNFHDWSGYFVAEVIPLMVWKEWLASQWLPMLLQSSINKLPRY